MTEKKDRRSRVGKLRDGIIEKIDRDIQRIRDRREARDRLDDTDNTMISMFEDQKEAINKLYEKNGKGEDNGE